MKLVVAVVQDQDAPLLLDKLSEEKSGLQSLQVQAAFLSRAIRRS